MFLWRLWMERTSMTQGTMDYRLTLLEYIVLYLATCMARACLMVFILGRTYHMVHIQELGWFKID